MTPDDENHLFLEHKNEKLPPKFLQSSNLCKFHHILWCIISDLAC